MSETIEAKLNQQRGTPGATGVVMPCPECQARMVLRSSRFGWFWTCPRWPACDGTHGARADGSPLGTPATKRVRQARIACHEAFDTLWRPDRRRRGEAYRWLQKVMHLSQEHCHIGRFTLRQCAEAIEMIKRRKKMDARAAGCHNVS